MAIRIPILTSFDPKGLKQANQQLGNLKGSVSSLGRNFAVLGAAIAGAGALVAKNVQALARIQELNAQTEQTIKSMGNTAGISAKGISELAGSLENLTAMEAESIQEGANLLLTFGNIKNQLGAGNDIFTQTTQIMVDLGTALKKGPVQTATMLGKALNDPIKGLSALTRVGVSFTKEQVAQVKALQESGDLMGAQKLILAELQKQYGGSGAAFAATFTGQLQLMGHELGTIGEEATMAVMPALQGMVTELRELIPVIGPQLKAAIESVDWKALTTAVVDFTTFLVENASGIAKVIAAVWLVNTAFKLMQVAIGISNVAIALKTWYLAQMTTGMTLSSLAAKGLSTAMRLIPFVAVTAAVITLASELAKSGEKFDAYKKALQGIDSSAGEAETNLAAFSLTATDIGAKVSPQIKIIDMLVKALSRIPKNVTSTVTVTTKTIGTGFGGSDVNDWRAGLGNAGGLGAGGSGGGGGGGGGGGTGKKAKTGLKALQATLAKEAKKAKKATRLSGKGLSEGLVDQILGSSTPIKTANKVLRKIAETGGKFGKKIQRQFNRTAAGQAEFAAQSEAASARAAQAAAEQAAAEEQRAREEQEAADREAAILAERERVYNSFLDSVKQTFSSIKDAIMGGFDITQMGSSTSSITRNMGKMLTRLRSFSANIKKLAGMGLDPELLKQVIAAGPMAGGKLAETLASSGVADLAAINAGYAEFGNLASEIATTGTEAMYGTTTQQAIYNIEVGGGVGSGPTIGKAIVDAIKSYERTSGAVWQGA